MFYSNSKLFRNKAFSLLELIITISIILIVTSLAAVSYGRYKKVSHKQLILSNLDLIKTGFQTCLKVKAFNKCDSPSEIEIQSPFSAVITARSDTANKKACFLMEFKGLKGCVDSQNNQTSQTELDSSSPSTSCSSAGICAP
ncbi:MAG: prepilin-type N-terminal cleavage/methylation domain-containing protein [Oligoflexia bacterium]|nr:prepilin-type N-terminal cleavage/methylation domain-containing protein [Oligoflexia bacterium]